MNVMATVEPPASAAESGVLGLLLLLTTSALGHTPSSSSTVTSCTPHRSSTCLSCLRRLVQSHHPSLRALQIAASHPHSHAFCWGPVLPASSQQMRCAMHVQSWGCWAGEAAIATHLQQCPGGGIGRVRKPMQFGVHLRCKPLLGNV